MNLTQILAPACIKVPVTQKDKTAIIGELVDLLDASGLLTDKNEALEAVLIREQTRSTGIGSGIAIPHGKCKSVKKLVMAVGISHEGIDFDSIDGKSVTIILLLVSPVDQTGPHIQALAQISRLMLDEQFKQNLQQTQDPQEVYELLSKREQSN